MYFLHGSTCALTFGCLPMPLLPNSPDKNPVCSDVSLLYHSLSSPPACGETGLLVLGLAVGLAVGLVIGLPFGIVGVASDSSS